MTTTFITISTKKVTEKSQLSTKSASAVTCDLFGVSKARAMDEAKMSTSTKRSKAGCHTTVAKARRTGLDQAKMKRLRSSGVSRGHSKPSSPGKRPSLGSPVTPRVLRRSTVCEPLRSAVFAGSASASTAPAPGRASAASDASVAVSTVARFPRRAPPWMPVRLLVSAVTRCMMLPWSWSYSASTGRALSWLSTMGLVGPMATGVDASSTCTRLPNAKTTLPGASILRAMSSSVISAFSTTSMLRRIMATKRLKTT
mmetsp:Transcript_27812/g.81734  ORF Transcript_27812/g.81734 Transcript_27812/m.81734 type:complete len:256 (+) Transcript_27812:2390-3157(+)